jgi:Glycosyltransferase sugar-binding region containing DXD motif
MRFLPDERLYWDADYCLDFLRELKPADEEEASANLRFHLYWRGAFSAKQAFAVKSIVATQRDCEEVCLWLDAEDGYDDHELNPALQGLPPLVSVRPFDPSAECLGTPLEDSPELYESLNPVFRSDLFRVVTLHNHGGVYLDLDVMLLRDLGDLLRQPFIGEEFCYRWSADLPYANNAVLAMVRESETATRVLERCAELGTCHPKEVLGFEGGDGLDLTVLPCPFFDPLWPHADGRSTLRRPPFDAFEGFFRKFGWRFRPRGGTHSYSDFFPGAFAYHWHNQWDASEHENSYFGRFSREFDAELASREPRQPAAAAE